MLHIDHLTFSFSSHQILNDFSLKLMKGEICTMIGISGSGKSTLFQILTGCFHPQSGSFLVDNTPPPLAYENLAYMMQDDLLLPWRTILENLTLIGELGKRKKALEDLKKEARFFLNEVGLQEWENAFPDQLSGGMRQRVSLARALMLKRPLLLLDEPFAALDVNLREQMHLLIKSICKKYGTTILLVTHDFQDAFALSDRIVLLNQGKITNEWSLTDDKRDPLVLAQIAREIKSRLSCIA